MSNRRGESVVRSVAETAWTPPVSADSRRRVSRTAAIAAAVTLGVSFVARIFVNAPVTVPGNLVVGGPGMGVAPGPLTALATGVAGVAAIAIALTDPEPVAVTGLLFVGVFGLLALVSRSAALSASVAVVAGTGAVVGSRRRQLRRTRLVPTAVLLAGLALALGSEFWGLTAIRPLSSAVSLIGIAALPLFAATDPEALLGGVLAFAGVLAVGLSLPFVTGAVTLVGGGVVGTSLPVVALAVAGAVTTASAAGRQGRWTLLAGAGLLAFAGVPATLPRAVPFALGLAVLTTTEGDQ